MENLVINTQEHPELNKFVINLFGSAGLKPHATKDKFYDDKKYLSTNFESNKYHYFAVNADSVESVLKVIKEQKNKCLYLDVYTDLKQIVKLLTQVREKTVNIDNYEVTFFKCGDLKVDCTTLPNSTVEKIIVERQEFLKND